MIRHRSFSIGGRHLNPGLAPEVLDILRGRQLDEDESFVVSTRWDRNHAAGLTRLMR